MNPQPVMQPAFPPHQQVALYQVGFNKISKKKLFKASRFYPIKVLLLFKFFNKLGRPLM